MTTTLAATIQQTELRLLKGCNEIEPSAFLARWVPRVYGVSLDEPKYEEACIIELQLWKADAEQPSIVLWLANEYYTLAACMGLLPRRTI